MTSTGASLSASEWHEREEARIAGTIFGLRRLPRASRPDRDLYAILYRPMAPLPWSLHRLLCRPRAPRARARTARTTTRGAAPGSGESPGPPGGRAARHGGERAGREGGAS
jgi:hypothetical protein